MTHLNPRVLAHMATNHGLVTAWQARDLGMSTTWIRHQVRTRLWIALHRGVYVDAEVWHALDPWHAQPLLRARAVMSVMKRDAVLSHDSAVHALELDYLAPPSPPGPVVHVTRPGATYASRTATHAVHLARFSAKDVVQVGDLRALGPARTAIDVTREHGLLAGLVTADSAMRRGVTRAELENVVDGMASWSNVTVCREVTALAHPHSQNAIESLGREFVIGLGIGDVDVQWPFQRSDGRLAWADIRVGRHIFETHGKVKVLSPELGGVAEKSAADVLWDTRKRERHATSEGLGVSNLYYEDFFGSQRAVARARVLAEVRQTIECYGDNVLPEHLARNAREIRAREERPGAS